MPTGLVLLRAFGYSEYLPVAIRVDSNGYQDADVANLATPAAFEPEAVEVHVRVLAFDWVVTPGFDLLVDLLVEFADCRRAYPCAPQRFGDVFHTPHTDPGKVHLHQRFLDAGLATLVALNDLRLKGQAP